jgi:glutamate N-acetyltransferase/amino-acid N-acetyltransferase
LASCPDKINAFNLNEVNTRLICAASYSSAKFHPNRVDVSVNGMALCRKGVDAGFDEAAAHREIDQKEILLHVDLHAGRAAARVWTCDLTRGYIDINSSYRS